MGQEKGLIEIAGKPMIQHVIDHIDPVCNQILISANKAEYNRFGYPVIMDEIKDIGPAGGIISLRAPDRFSGRCTGGAPS